ncbi:MAG: hypothetical protein IPL65_01315 [Lewinellaceae bacterium]|nr:hypothetical protein [Lewinellaceae bacterium]
MKRIFFLLLLSLAFSSTNYAQSIESAVPSSASTQQADPAREATDALVAKYDLNNTQAKQIFTIQQRKLRNLGDIASLETENPALYASKLRSIQKGTLASIRRILRTEAQVSKYQQTQMEIRVQQAEKRKEMTQNGASAAEIDAALLLIYGE